MINERVNGNSNELYSCAERLVWMRSAIFEMSYQVRSGLVGI